MTSNYQPASSVCFNKSKQKSMKK